MYAFFKKSLHEIGLLPQLTDYHSHILPGVDDGVKKIEDSLEILQQYEHYGVQNVVLTPHIMEEYPKNQPGYLREQFAQFCATYKGSINLRIGAEYMIDGSFSTHLQKGDLLTIKDNFILVETSYAFEPPGFLASISEARNLGYGVILAHPERYSYFNGSIFKQLKQLGVLLQLNLPSLLEYYGTQVAQNARELLQNNEYSFMGSDIHRVHSLEIIFKSKGLGRREIEGIRRLVNSEL